MIIPPKIAKIILLKIRLLKINRLNGLYINPIKKPIQKDEHSIQRSIFENIPFKFLAIKFRIGIKMSANDHKQLIPIVINKYIIIFSNIFYNTIKKLIFQKKISVN